MKSLKLKILKHLLDMTIEMPKIHKGYIMDEEVARDFFACEDR